MSTTLKWNTSFKADAAKITNPATYAFLGDAVYGLLVRSKLAAVPRQAGELHRVSVKLVNAAAQAQAFRVMEPLLSEEEMTVFKRGRNYHPGHTPKGASSQDYHTATGVEALFGYLYMNGQTDEIDRLFDAVWQDFLATQTDETGHVRQNMTNCARNIKNRQV